MPTVNCPGKHGNFYKNENSFKRKLGFLGVFFSCLFLWGFCCCWFWVFEIFQLLKPVPFQAEMFIKTTGLFCLELTSYHCFKYLSSAMIFFKSWVLFQSWVNFKIMICLFSACTHHSFAYLSSSAWERDLIYRKYIDIWFCSQFCMSILRQDSSIQFSAIQIVILMPQF